MESSKTIEELQNYNFEIKKIFSDAKDFLPIQGTDYIELYVGNAKQSAHYYKTAFGFQSEAYSGLETGDKESTSYVLKQGKIRLVLTTSLKKGSLIITRGDNKHIKNFDQTLISIANKHLKYANSIATGFSDKGPDMGSSDVRELKNQKIAVLSGEKTSSLSYGEIQYFFEQDIKYPFTAIHTDNFSVGMLDNYHTLVIPNGYYGGLFSKIDLDKLSAWIRSGGKVIAIGNANSIFAGKKGFGLQTKSSAENEDKDDKEIELTNYEDLERESISGSITGAIFKTKIDNSHPLGFGYGDSYFTLKQGARSYDYLEDGYNVVRLEDNISFSGFVGSKADKNLSKSLIFGEEGLGRGSIIYMVDNPLFRAFWDNGKLFFANALFYTNPSMKKL